MSKTLPIAAPGWATDANYAAGASPWSGAPTRIQPPGGFLAKGFTPGQKPPAQYMNWALGQHSDNIAATAQIAAHGALQTWRAATIPANGATAKLLVPVGIGALNQRILFALEADTTHSNHTYWNRSNDGSSWVGASPVSPTFSSLIDAEAGPAGTIMLVDGTTTSVQYTTNYGVTWANVSFGPTACVATHYALGQYWACQKTQVWTASSIAGFGGGTVFSMPIPGSGVFAGIPEFADNGTDTVCLVGAPTSGVTYPSVYVTTNLGASWTKVLDLTGATTANIAYSSLLGLFITWDSTGSVSTSADGVTWIRGTAVTGSSAAGLSTNPRSLAIAGAVLAKLYNSSVAGYATTGVAYSFDLGASWFVSAFGQVGQFLTQLRAANNRLYAIDGFNLWTSGIVGSNDKDF